MLYQNILKDDQPYQLLLGRLNPFTEHRHADIEFSYCIHGDFDIFLDKKQYHLNEGEVILIPPMMSHEIPSGGTQDRLVITAILGPTFLKKDFGLFANAKINSPIFTFEENRKLGEKIRALFEEILSVYHTALPSKGLMLTGDLYRICACLWEALSLKQDAKQEDKKDLRRIANIEKALEMIYYDYKKPLTVDDAAAATGYGKSNFCKIFKNIVGESFHRTLNRQRIKSACGFLERTNMPIAEIAQEVGFDEAKTFCRVFKEIMGITPGTYRKNR